MATADLHSHTALLASHSGPGAHLHLIINPFLQEAEPERSPPPKEASWPYQAGALRFRSGATSPAEDLKPTLSAGSWEEVQGKHKTPGAVSIPCCTAIQFARQVSSQPTLAAAHATSQQTAPPAPQTKLFFHSPKHTALDYVSALAGGKEGRIIIKVSPLKEGKRDTVTQRKQNHEETELEGARKRVYRKA